jgi:hypothetical protein
MHLAFAPARYAKEGVETTLREHVHVEIGDLIEANVEDGKITVTPKSLIDRSVAEGPEDMKQGRTHGPYANVRAIRALETHAERRRRGVRIAQRGAKRNAG